MAVWQICFLGVPRAAKDGVEKRPRATVTWALMASLLLPRMLLLKSGQPLSAFPVPPKLPRADLAKRFWGDKAAPAVHLRQALPGLRKIFAEGYRTVGIDGSRDGDCGIHADLDSVWVSPRYFESDIELVVNAFHRAMGAGSKEERLAWLSEAEKKIAGRFLEGCFQPDREGAWFRKYRDHVHDTMVTILIALASALIEEGSIHAAQEVLQKALRIEPRHEAASRLLWETALRTEQRTITHLLHGAESLREAASRFRDVGRDKLTLKEGREFDALLEFELNRLSDSRREQFLSLSLFPAPFSADLAGLVCRVTPSTLEALTQSPLVERCGDGFRIARVIQESARLIVPAQLRKRFITRLRRVCVDRIPLFPSQPEASEALFGRIEEAEPLLDLVLDWLIQQPTSAGAFTLIDYIRFLGLPELARRALPYLIQALRDETLDDRLRAAAGGYAAEIHRTFREFGLAAHIFEGTLVLVQRFADPTDLGYYHSCLMTAYHYSGDTNTAIVHAAKAIVCHIAQSDLIGAAGGFRFLSELQFSIGQYEAALRSADEALNIRRSLNVEPSGIADALYWKGRAQLALNEGGPAAAAFREALDLWQTSGDSTGTGHCLRHLGMLRARGGCYSEGRAQIEYAILLHERSGDLPSEIAARDALGQFFLLEGKRDEARAAFQRCVTDSIAANLEAWAAKYRNQIAEIDNASDNG